MQTLEEQLETLEAQLRLLRAIQIAMIECTPERIAERQRSEFLRDLERIARPDAEA
jgi:hypothetical protein